MLGQRRATNTAKLRAVPFEVEMDILDRKSHANTAVGRWRKSADRGDADAQYKLGLAYIKGPGSSENKSEGARWLRQAAEQGHIEAQVNMGVAYALGTGVLQDAVMAHMWFNLAAAKGNSRARENRIKIVRRMNREQVAEAQRLARDWNRDLHYWADPQL